MSSTVTISKTEFEKLLERIKTLESFVFGKRKVARAKNAKTPDEILTPRQEAILQKKYDKAKADFAKGEGVVVSSVEEMMKALRP